MLHKSTSTEVGNDKADNTADIGAKLHGADMMTIARCMHKRHSAYQNFMVDVSHHIIEAYLLHRALLEKKSKLQS